MPSYTYISLNRFLTDLDTVIDTLNFSDVLQIIGSNYTFTETAFTNGGLTNEAGENSGSCKVFSFAIANKLTEKQTLSLFAEHYRDDVLIDDNGNNHQNIRQFMRTGFAGLSFSQQALKPIN